MPGCCNCALAALLPVCVLYMSVCSQLMYILYALVFVDLQMVAFWCSLDPQTVETLETTWWCTSLLMEVLLSSTT